MAPTVENCAISRGCAAKLTSRLGTRLFGVPATSRRAASGTSRDRVRVTDSRGGSAEVPCERQRIRILGHDIPLDFSAQVAAALEPSTSSPLASTPFRASRSLRLIAIAAVPLSSCFFVNVEKEWMFVGR